MTPKATIRFRQVTAAAAIVWALLALLVGVGLWHMKLGLQTIIEDYIHGEGCKLALQITMTFATVLLGVAGLIALVMLAAMPPA